jgi:hypothetical protein
VHNVVNFKFISTLNAREEILHVVDCQTASVDPVESDKHLILGHCVLLVAEGSHRSFQTI